MKALNNNRGVVIAPVLRLILENLLKDRKHLKTSYDIFRLERGGGGGGGSCGQSIYAQSTNYHCRYVKREVWITFSDTENSFDGL